MNGNGILAVKTLLGSLNGDKESDERKRRRKQFLSSVHSSLGEERNDETDATHSTEKSVMSSEGDSNAISTGTVGFTTVSIREYEIVPGCNPSVSVGCPVSLGWGYTEETHMQFHAFENVRQPQRRMQHQMRMPRAYREDKLLDFGYTKKDLKKADKDAHKIRTKRLSAANKFL